MADFLQRWAANRMNQVHVNRTQECLQAGRPTVLKQRRAGMGMTIALGNQFLAWAGSAAQIIPDAGEWIAWEIHCSKLLYPERRAEAVVSRRAVQIDKVPGESLRQLIRQNRLEARCVVAAARELRRVHQVRCCHFAADWSHGDLHLDNVLYDASTDRVAFIDFDTRHLPGVEATQRKSDDLKVFLLELLARLEDGSDQAARAFVAEYGASAVLKELARQLVIPVGLARVLWYTQTHGVASDRMEPGIQSLRHGLAELVGYRS